MDYLPSGGDSLSDVLRSETRDAALALQNEMTAVPQVQHASLVSRLQSLPVRRGRWWYYYRHRDGRRHLCRVPATGWDPPERAAIGTASEDEVVLHPHLAHVVGLEPDPRTGRTYAIEHVGGGRMRLSFLVDPAERDEAPPPIDGVGRKAAWAANPEWIFYTRLDSALRSTQLWVRNIEDPGSDVMLSREQDPEFEVIVYRTGDRIVSLASSAAASETSEYYLEDGRWRRRVLVPRDSQILHRVVYAGTWEGEQWYLVRHKRAHGDQDLSLARASDLGPGTDPSRWARVFTSTRRCTLSNAHLVGSRVVLSVRRNALPGVGLMDLRAPGDPVLLRADPAEDELVGLDVIELDSDSPFLRLLSTSYTRPPRILDYRYSDGSFHERGAQEEDLPDPDTRATREWVTSDGVEVPVTVLRRAGTRPDGTHPGVLVAYGSYQTSLDPDSSEEWLPLLQRGVVVMLAHVRGGGELGGWWHEAGTGPRKLDSIADFEACARHAVTSGWVARGRLGGCAASAGGVLLAASLNRSPGLFRACLLRQPFVNPYDALREPGLPLTVSDWGEFGDPLHDEDMATVIRGYSPYQNVREQSYPAVAVVLGETDTRIRNADAVGWAVRVREATTTGAPVYLWTVEGAGHGCEAPAFELAFWRRELCGD